jgi:hypothetical protein
MLSYFLFLNFEKLITDNRYPINRTLKILFIHNTQIHFNEQIHNCGNSLRMTFLGMLMIFSAHSGRGIHHIPFCIQGMLQQILNTDHK